MVVIEGSASVDSGRPEGQTGPQKDQQSALSCDDTTQPMHELCIGRIVVPRCHAGKCPTGDPPYQVDPRRPRSVRSVLTRLGCCVSGVEERNWIGEEERTKGLRKPMMAAVVAVIREGESPCTFDGLLRLR